MASCKCSVLDRQVNKLLDIKVDLGSGIMMGLAVSAVWAVAWELWLRDVVVNAAGRQAFSQAAYR
jgi:hypothetical protein